MAAFKSLCGCVFSFCFRGVTQLNSSNPIGSASKTARFGASVFVKELIKDFTAFYCIFVFFSRLIDLLHFTCIFSITFFTRKTKGVTHGIPI